MGNPPQSFMIFQEELRKEKLEKKRLQQEHRAKVQELSTHMEVLKERIASQEEMLKSALGYAMDLEQKLSLYKEQLDRDNDRNSSGFH